MFAYFGLCLRLINPNKIYTLDCHYMTGKQPENNDNANCKRNGLHYKG